MRGHENDLKAGVWPIYSKGLVKTYSNGFTAVCGNSLGVRKGEIVGLVGPGNSGKTSTLQMLSIEIPVT